MESIKDFVLAAFPWVMMGLAVAVLASSYFRKKRNDKKHRQSTAWFTASILAYLNVAMSLIGHTNSSSYTTWLCLGSAFLCFGALEFNKENKNNDNDNDNDTTKQ